MPQQRLNPSTETDLKLPRNYRGYRYVDVARAVPELRSPHSGLSLLRVPIAQSASSSSSRPRAAHRS